LARANVESLVLLDSLTRGFDTLLRHHIERTFRPIETMENRSGVDLVRRSVGFADLVDSTSWTLHLDVTLLSRALTRFEATASEIVVGREGRVVKLIGDEVMFVANDAVAAVDIALALISAFASDDVLPPVRAGVATGEVLARDGDYSGSVVNLAARAVKIASPSTLLVDDTTRDALHDCETLSVSDARSYSLKGLAQPVQLSQVTRVTDRAP
jgi:adenylate cyclase